MCKTRFDSQGIILNVLLQKKTFLEKNVNGTRGGPLMANAIKDFRIFLRLPYVVWYGVLWCGLVCKISQL